MLGPLFDALQTDGAVRDDVRPSLESAHRNSLRLLKLVNTLLDFSRIEAGRMQARFEPVDIGVLTADLASAFRSAMEKAGLDFAVETERDPRARLRRSGDVGEDRPQSPLERVQVHVRRRDHGVAPRARATASSSSVRDTGVGIPDGGAAARVRSLPPRRRHARAHA